MIVVIDYGMGNLRSAEKGIEKGGHEAVISDDPGSLSDADGVVLPGVGAFKDCYDGLCSRGFREPLLEFAESGKPLLGICVGMQLLFEGSDEGAGSVGLGLLKGQVVRFPDSEESGLKVPHMGWNRLDVQRDRACPLLQGLSLESYVYFVHSYYPAAERESEVYATTEYGVTFPSVVGRDAIFGVQFHPEKSQREGIAILRSFGDYVDARSN